MNWRKTFVFGYAPVPYMILNFIAFQVHRSTGRDCFPKMTPTCFREGTGFLNFLF